MLVGIPALSGGASHPESRAPCGAPVRPSPAHAQRRRAQPGSRPPKAPRASEVGVQRRALTRASTAPRSRPRRPCSAWHRSHACCSQLVCSVVELYPKRPHGQRRWPQAAGRRHPLGELEHAALMSPDGATSTALERKNKTRRRGLGQWGKPRRGFPSAVVKPARSAGLSKPAVLAQAHLEALREPTAAPAAHAPMGALRRSHAVVVVFPVLDARDPLRNQGHPALGPLLWTHSYDRRAFF